MELAQKKVELVVRLKKESATRDEAATLVPVGAAEVVAACSYWDRDGRVFFLVSENPEKTERALRAAGLGCRTNFVVLIGPLEHPGVAARLGAAFAAAGIGVLSSYGSWSADWRGYVVFKTTDDERAVTVATDNLARFGAEIRPGRPTAPQPVRT